MTGKESPKEGDKGSPRRMWSNSCNAGEVLLSRFVIHHPSINTIKNFSQIDLSRGYLA